MSPCQSWLPVELIWFVVNHDSHEELLKSCKKKKKKKAKLLAKSSLHSNYTELNLFLNFFVKVQS